MNFLPLSPCGYMPSVPSRPRTPSPPFRRGGGVGITFDSENTTGVCFATPPPPSQRGEGVRGREEDSALSRNGKINE